MASTRASMGVLTCASNNCFRGRNQSRLLLRARFRKNVSASGGNPANVVFSPVTLEPVTLSSPSIISEDALSPSGDSQFTRVCKRFAGQPYALRNRRSGAGAAGRGRRNRFDGRLARYRRGRLATDSDRGRKQFIG